MVDKQHPAQVSPKMRERIIRHGTREARTKLELADDELLAAQEEGVAPTPSPKPGQN